MARPLVIALLLAYWRAGVTTAALDVFALTDEMRVQKETKFSPGLNFAGTFGDDMVLQQAPAVPAVFGVIADDSGAAGGTVEVTVSETATATATGERDTSYSVTTSVDNKLVWKARLRPRAAGGDVTITARCTAGCANDTAVALKHVTFGDVSAAVNQASLPTPSCPPDPRR